MDDMGNIENKYKKHLLSIDRRQAGQAQASAYSSFFKGAAVVCLVALSGLQPAAGALQLTVKKAGTDAYTSVNLARVGQLSVRIGVLAEDSDLAKGLETSFPTTSFEPPADTCENFIKALKKKKFVAQFTDASAENYRQAVQEALTAGLGKLTSYPETDTEEAWTPFWTEPDGANLAHLLWSKSTKVGCAIGTCAPQAEEYRSSPDSATFLVCEMNPAAVEKQAPFE
ncbi:LOW QUALITY PROTEIN: SAG family member [Eimeria mitis]|uniref:SAG family member n=1 Tax=Eimeria mitis TaxID=44415 RepID=U6K015_9EIME|nr:LOW QUALITY PROTEIN: SAG family member [Eimeria mitis]CDJ29657.1 SAG family member [Eimeria mitis]